MKRTVKSNISNNLSNIVRQISNPLFIIEYFKALHNSDCIKKAINIIDEINPNQVVNRCGCCTSISIILNIDIDCTYIDNIRENLRLQFLMLEYSKFKCFR